MYDGPEDAETVAFFLCVRCTNFMFQLLLSAGRCRSLNDRLSHVSVAVLSCTLNLSKKISCWTDSAQHILLDWRALWQSCAAFAFRLPMEPVSWSSDNVGYRCRHVVGFPFRGLTGCAPTPCVNEFRLRSIPQKAAAVTAVAWLSTLWVPRFSQTVSERTTFDHGRSLSFFFVSFHFVGTWVLSTAVVISTIHNLTQPFSHNNLHATLSIKFILHNGMWTKMPCTFLFTWRGLTF